MEIITKHWTKQEILKRMNELVQQKKMMQDRDINTEEVDVLITTWQEKYDKL